MSFLLESDRCRLVVSPIGAELQSLWCKQSNREVLWQADPAWWPRHAPLLFPIVGRLREGTADFHNRRISLPQHGFARDSVFQLISQTTTALHLQLTSNPETLKLFPFRFCLDVCHQLQQAGVITTMAVSCPPEADGLPFSLGAHPGFNLPFYPNQSSEGYFLLFEYAEMLETCLLRDGLLSGDTKLIGSNVLQVPVHPKLFQQDALIFKNLKSGWVRLVNEQTGEYVQVGISGWPYLGVWTKPGAPFLCIEPWQGITDAANASGNFSEKQGLMYLQPGEVFERVLTITLS